MAALFDTAISRWELTRLTRLGIRRFPDSSTSISKPSITPAFTTESPSRCREFAPFRHKNHLTRANLAPSSRLFTYVLRSNYFSKSYFCPVFLPLPPQQNRLKPTSRPSTKPSSPETSQTLSTPKMTKTRASIDDSRGVSTPVNSL
jgi:hypothetical protein